LCAVLKIQIKDFGEIRGLFLYISSVLWYTGKSKNYLRRNTERSKSVLMLEADITKHFRDAEMVLIGVGEELKPDGSSQRSDRIVMAFNTLPPLLRGKTYFVVSQNSDDLVFRSNLLPFFIAEPYGPKENSSCSEEQWNTYLRWVSGTLGHRLLLLELGVGFASPELIRWPFEKITQINMKSSLIRVHASFPQLPKELAETGRAFSVKCNSIEWLEKLKQWDEKADQKEDA
jgi:hypothetical protein